jgi:hypothetical protein
MLISDAALHTVAYSKGRSAILPSGFEPCIVPSLHLAQLARVTAATKAERVRVRSDQTSTVQFGRSAAPGGAVKYGMPHADLRGPPISAFWPNFENVLVISAPFGSLRRTIFHLSAAAHKHFRFRQSQ